MGEVALEEKTARRLILAPRSSDPYEKLQDSDSTEGWRFYLSVSQCTNDVRPVVISRCSSELYPFQVADSEVVRRAACKVGQSRRSLTENQACVPPEGGNTPVCCTSLVQELHDACHNDKIEACMQVVATREAVAMATRGAWKVSIPG